MTDYALQNTETLSPVIRYTYRGRKVIIHCENSEEAVDRWVGLYKHFRKHFRKTKGAELELYENGKLIHHHKF